MDNFDDSSELQLTAITPGLGLQEPQIIAEPPHEKVILKEKRNPVEVISHQQKKYTGFALLLDHFFVFLFYFILLLTYVLSFNSISFREWIQTMGSPNHLLLYMFLFIIIYSFYFLFFKLFKTPTPGQWISSEIKD